jgi:hypothetical protein
LKVYTDNSKSYLLPLSKFPKINGVALSTEFCKQLNKEHYIYFWQFAKGAKITFEAIATGDRMTFKN